jgi:DNA-binding beta-propeller fold protein YncE
VGDDVIAALAFRVVLALAGDAPTIVAMPGADGGEIGFDDMAYAPSLDIVIVPSAATMKVNFVDAQSHAITSTFALPPVVDDKAKKGGHGDGTTSAVFDPAHKIVIASDRTRKVIDVFDADSKALVSSTPLMAGPDYVRIVKNEVWVSEPHTKQIEWFTIGADKKLTKGGAISFVDGPESLAFDEASGRAYTHAWKSQTYAVDVAKHAVLSTWDNGCKGSRGIAFDGDAKLVLVGCEEGKVVALDASTGAIKGSLQTSVSDVDIIAFNPALRHVYVPGAKSMAIVSLSKAGAFAPLGLVATADDEAHCVVADNHAQAWVCDPKKGRVLVVKDTYPATK